MPDSGDAAEFVFALLIGVALALAFGLAFGHLASFQAGKGRRGLFPAWRPGSAGQHVLVVEGELMSEGVKTLLNSSGGLKVTGVMAEDETSLLEAVERDQPDVIVLDRASRVTNPADLMYLLRDRPRLRIMVVSAADDVVHIYDKHQMQIRHGKDLVAMV